MTKAFDEILQSKGAALQETLSRIHEEVEEAYDPDGDSYRDDIFARQVIEILEQRHDILMPEIEREDEYFLSQHRFNARVNGRQINVWGSALVKNQNATSFTLHVFTTDYSVGGNVEELPQADGQKLLGEAFQFFYQSVRGNFENEVSDQHPAWSFARRIRMIGERITAVRCWLISSRVLAGETNAGRQDVKNIDVSLKIVDLQEIARTFLGKTGISQSFQEIGGLPCFETRSEDQDYDCIQAVLSGTNLAELYSIHGTSLVEANVRAYLGDSKVNKGIRETIEDHPGDFLAFNNGLVVSASAVKIVDHKLMRIEGLQIVNGGQTTASIYQAWLSARKDAYDADPKRRQAGELHLHNLNVVHIPAKIIVPLPSMNEDDWKEFLVNISVAANSQNRINVSDLSANSPFQVELGRLISALKTPQNDYWFYEQYRGLYKAKWKKASDQKSFRRQFPASKVIGKTDLAIAALCWDGQAQDCAKGREKAFGIFQKLAEHSCVYDGKVKLSLREVKELIGKWIIFSIIQKAVRKDEDLKIANPRVPVLYAIALFAHEYGDKVNWDSIWNRQGLSESFICEMKKLVRIVDAIMRRNMGDMMIAMWGRKAECMRTLHANFSFDKFDELNFDLVYELSL